jgi:hypothetical protein
MSGLKLWKKKDHVMNVRRMWIKNEHVMDVRRSWRKRAFDEFEESIWQD